MLYPQLVTCSRIQSFEHLIFRFCGDLVRWKSRTVSALGSSLCPSAHVSGVYIHMAATSLTTQRGASDLVINPLTSLCSYISVPLTCLAPTASCAANMHNKEERNAGNTNMSVREEDVHDRNPVRQGHVSAFPFTLFAVASESFASQLCLPTALAHGRFASSLCLCLCVCLCLPVFLCLSVYLSFPCMSLKNAPCVSPNASVSSETGAFLRHTQRRCEFTHGACGQLEISFSIYFST